MVNKNYIATIKRAAEMGDCTYESFEHLLALLDGMKAITESPTLTESGKLSSLERLVKAANYLANDGAALVDGETSRLRSLLSGGEV